MIRQGEQRMERNRSGARWARLAALLVTGATVVGPGASIARDAIDFQPFTLTSWDGRTAAAELGYLPVPERRDGGTGREIEIAVLRLPSTAAVPGPPIVYLAGGPGGSGITSAAGLQFDAFLALRAIGDVIAIDQRGTGRSRPALECGERLRLPAEQRITEEALFEEFRIQLARCQRTWERRGVDPAGYTTVESADDLEALRTALGVDRISLWAGSYGTHLALATLRRHPEAIERAILMGVEGPDHTLKLPARVDRTLRKLSRLVARSPEVGSEVPDLVQLLRDLTGRLARDPLFASTVDPVGGGPVQVAIDDLFVRLAAAAAMGDREDMASLPALLRLLDERIVPEEVAAAAMALRRLEVTPLMRWTMDCASGVSERRWAKILRQEDRFVLGRSLDLTIPDVCDAVDVPDLGQEFRSRLRSDVPTLFVSGDLDGRTPPANAREIAKGFDDATHVTLRLGSHDDLFTSHPELVAAFLDFLAGRPGWRRTIRLDPIEFEAVPPARRAATAPSLPPAGR